MEYKCISSDCHIDLIWLPPDLFTSNASGQIKNRMPYVDMEAEGDCAESAVAAPFLVLSTAWDRPAENMRQDKLIAPTWWRRRGFTTTV